MLSQFMASNRSLFRDANIEEEGRILTNTQTRAHITSHVVLEALKTHKDQKMAAAAKRKRPATEFSVLLASRNLLQL